MATRFVFLVCSIFVWFGIQTNAQNWTSPCPDVFKYQVERNRWNKWYGTITLFSDVDLEGIWVRVLFDGPVEQLTAEFQEYGEVSGKENEFVIKDPYRKLKANTKLDVDFYIKFNDQIQTPKLLEIYINDKLICAKNKNGVSVTDTVITQNIPSTTENVRNSKYNLKAFTPHEIEIFVQFNADTGEVAGPRLSGFRLIAKLVSSTDKGGVQGVVDGTTEATKRPDVSGTTTSLSPITEKFKRQISNSYCGISETVPGAPLIVGGWDSIEGEWPWQSAIYKNDAGTWKYYCGGTIIAPRFILTAGHCVVDLDTGYTEPAINFLVYVGTTNLKKLPFTTKTAQVEKIHTHSKFSKQNLHNDIALLELWRPLDYDVYVKPVCLWQGSNNLADIVDQLGTVVGWGRDDTKGVSDRLKQARMPVVAHDVCLFSKPKFFSTFLNPNSYCAGFRNGSSVCNGDSGSGMVIERPDGNGEKSWQLRGVVSVSIPKPGTRICNPMEYMVFTDVAKYLTWIKQIINENPVTTSQKPTVTSSISDTFMAANKTVQCGLKTQVRTLVYNGKRGEEFWPWHVAIMLLKTDKFEYHCGGTLVSSKSVLTAAHCVTVLRTEKIIDKDLFLLYLGLTDISDPGPYFKVGLVKDIIIHNEFEPLRYFNDLAIVKIDIEFNDFIKPICLWDGDLAITSLIGQYGTVVGWRINRSNETVHDLVEAKMPIVGLESCLYDDRNFFSQYTSPTTFCAGGPNGTGICGGDSGGAIVFPRQNTQIDKDIWYIRGIVSVTPLDAESVCNTKRYVVFTDVARHLAWIKDTAAVQ